MYKFFLNLIIFVIISFQNQAFSIEEFKKNYSQVSFDVVEKELIIDDNIPLYFKKLTKRWFDEKVKIDGFDGNMTFTLFGYNEKISIINSSKRIDASIKFQIILNKPSLNSKEKIQGEVSSYGVITGSFSLNEFDDIIKSTQVDLLDRIIKELKLIN